MWDWTDDDVRVVEVMRAATGPPWCCQKGGSAELSAGGTRLGASFPPSNGTRVTHREAVVQGTGHCPRRKESSVGYAAAGRLSIITEGVKAWLPQNSPCFGISLLSGSQAPFFPLPLLCNVELMLFLFGSEAVELLQPALSVLGGDGVAPLAMEHRVTARLERERAQLLRTANTAAGSGDPSARATSNATMSATIKAHAPEASPTCAGTHQESVP